MSDMEQLHKAIKSMEREIIEARNINIKTDNSMRSLFAEMKKVSGNQERAEKKAKIGTIGVYIIFVVLLSLAFFLISSLQSASLNEKIASLQADKQKVQAHVEDLTKKLEAREAAEKRVVYVLNLIKEDKKTEAVDEFRKIDKSKLSKAEMALLQQRIDDFSAQLAKTHYDQGAAQWRIGGYKSAVQELKLSLDYQAETEYSGMLYYYLGHSQLQLKDIDEGIANLKKAISEDIGRENADRSRLAIADTLTAADRLEEALSYLQNIPIMSCGFYTRQAIQMKINDLTRRVNAKKTEQ